MRFDYLEPKTIHEAVSAASVKVHKDGTIELRYGSDDAVMSSLGIRR